MSNPNPKRSAECSDHNYLSPGDGPCPPACYDCDRPYGAAHGFPDFIVPFEVWKRITPTEDDGGLLCPSCICKRLHGAGIQCVGAFVSGPVISVSQATIEVLRRVENIELALDGRDNRWGAALRDRIHEVNAKGLFE